MKIINFTNFLLSKLSKLVKKGQKAKIANNYHLSKPYCYIVYAHSIFSEGKFDQIRNHKQVMLQVHCKKIFSYVGSH